MNVRVFLKENDLRLTWLQKRLHERGYEVEISHLCRIVGGIRRSQRAQDILRECREICRTYDALKKAL